MLRLPILIATLTIAGCGGWAPSFYSIDIRQGNYIDREMVQQLRPGMSRRQVRFLLGTPPIADTFHRDRWDYVYVLRPEGGKPSIERRVTVYFSGDVVSRIETDSENWKG